MPSSKNLCIHTHFYQPSREDPFSGIIPDEPGASPYRNWNEKIFEDCYRPNVEVGNFNKISFNIGPTLSQWMKNTHPDTFNQIVNADKKNVEKYGVGNAIAQSYHHSILPLASSRDKQTQISWGIYDFQRTFGRKPQGMWLPETAVDTECLELLAQNGIQFTILAPWQAESDEIDPKKIYQVALRDGKSIKIIFYHSGISSRISFDPNSTLNADLFNQNYISSEFSSSRESEMLLVA
jgi:alpha-amylase/alpha-mannosidase (GH57 family)